ncbi:MAG: hypothetical protein DYG93_07870 [Leptolyngbya sp. PLA2]|nr:hypothetical protein [Leptolyngbya sp. PL-A2]
MAECASWSAAAMLLCLLCLLGGCATNSETQRIERGPAPRYADVAVRYNQTADRLDRVWSRITVSVRSPTGKGGRETVEQAEGHLLIRRPNDLALSVNKLGETYFYLGSNEGFYWWIDLTDRSRRYALVGLHDLATPETSLEFGVPVHPRELVELFAITPLPMPEAPGVGPAAPPGWTRWSDDGRLLGVILPSRWGTRRMWLDPDTYEAAMVELLGEDGEPIAVSTLSRYDYVPVRGDGRVGPRMAMMIRVDVPDAETTITLRLFEPENREVSDRAFDLERLLRDFRVAEVFSLDERPDTNEQPSEADGVAE